MIRAVRGFNDILPDQTGLWNLVEKRASDLFSAYGFSEIRVPVVERTGLFARSIGSTTDIVEKEMYTFSDRRGESITLRPEGTAGVVRAYIEHKLYTRPLVKLHYRGPMFRYERPQKGRYRQFHQIGAEVLGDGSAGADAEVIEMLVRYIEGLGLRDLLLQINSLGCRSCRPGYREKLRAFLEKKADSLCTDCRRRININPLRALDCKNPGCIEATGGAPSILDSLCEACAAHFTELRTRLGERDVRAEVNPRMVRGLDYYTRTTFEVLSGGLGAQNAVAAGGRYDDLVAELGGPPTPCLGFAIGVERLVLLLRAAGLEVKRPLVFFITLGDEARKKGAELLSDLRKKGHSVIEDFSAGPLKKRMKRAHRLGARFVVILGEDELKRGEATVRDMETSRQEGLSWEVVGDWISVESGESRKA